MAAKFLFYTFFFGFLISIQAQDPLYTWPDSLLKTESLKLVKERALDFNKGIEPQYFEKEESLLDSLRENNINHMITYFDFSAIDENMENPSVIAGKSTTMDREVPFIRFRLERTELGDFVITVIQGHNHW